MKSLLVLHRSNQNFFAPLLIALLLSGCGGGSPAANNGNPPPAVNANQGNVNAASGVPATPPNVSGSDVSVAGASRWTQGVHPRIWLTPQLVTEVRGFAKKPGSLYPTLKKVADEMVADVLAGTIPGICVDNNGDGLQDMDAQGYSPLVPWDNGTMALDSGKHVTEMYAQMFAFMALVSPRDTPAEIALADQYKTRAHDLVMEFINRAAVGPYDEQAECVVPQQAAHPGMSAYDATQTCFCREKRRFRTQKAYYSSEYSPFLSADRGFITGDALPTAIDWTYDSFTPAELAKIRQVFAAFADELVRLPYYASKPAYQINSDATLHLEDPRLSDFRFYANNHYLSYGRAIGMMALALDKDGSAAAPKVTGSDGQQRRLEDFAPIAIDAYLRNTDKQRRLDSRGGMSPEGSMYSALGLRFELSLRLAMLTSGETLPDIGTGRSSIYNHPFWDGVVPTYMHTLLNQPRLDVNPGNSYQGPVYERIVFGDCQSESWQTQPDTDFFAMLGVYDHLSGQEARAKDLKWIIRNAFPGGDAKLEYRISTVLSQDLIRGAILSHILLNPDDAAIDPVTDDPRQGMSPALYLPDLGTTISRTGWDADARLISFRNGWGRIDHNHQDGNSFDFFRKNRALTRKWLAYGQKAGLSEFSNTLALKNYCGGPNGAAGNATGAVFQPATDTLKAVIDSGSQQYLGASTQAGYNAYKAAYQADPTSNFWQENNPLDPKILAYSDGAGQDYTAITGDSTVLYNRWNQWDPGQTCEDITHASRTLVWLKPDHLVIYDRASSIHSGFKRFWLSLPPQGYSLPLSADMSHITITPNANDVLTGVQLPDIQVQGGGASSHYEAQQLFVRTLLPLPADVTVSKDNQHPNDGYDLSAGNGQVMRMRLKVEANGDPTNVRFLHVLQGADAGVAADAAVRLQSDDAAFDGAMVKGYAVLFARDLANVPASFSYSTPLGTTQHRVTGLTPGGKYTVTLQQLAASVKASISADPSGALTADAGGVLVFQ